MSATNKTPNYNLPLYTGSDQPSYLTDWNGAMTAIDNAINGAYTNAQEATAQVAAQNAKIEQIEEEGHANATAIVGTNNNVAANTAAINAISNWKYAESEMTGATGNINIKYNKYLNLVSIYAKPSYITTVKNTQYPDYVTLVTGFVPTEIRPATAVQIFSAGSIYLSGSAYPASLIIDTNGDILMTAPAASNAAANISAFVTSYMW